MSTYYMPGWNPGAVCASTQSHPVTIYKVSSELSASSADGKLIYFPWPASPPQLGGAAAAEKLTRWISDLLVKGCYCLPLEGTDPSLWSLEVSRTHPPLSPSMSFQSWLNTSLNLFMPFISVTVSM